MIDGVTRKGLLLPTEFCLESGLLPGSRIMLLLFVLDLDNKQDSVLLVSEGNIKDSTSMLAEK